MSAAVIPVLTPPAEITEGALPEFLALFEPHLEGTAPGIVLDLGEVDFINSAGLGSLVKLGMRLDRDGRRLALARPGKSVDRMLRLIGLESKMPIFRTVEEASAHITRFARQQR